MSDTPVFQQQADAPDEAWQRMEASRQTMHDFIDDMPGLSDREKLRRKTEYDNQHADIVAASGMSAPAPVDPAEARYDERWRRTREMTASTGTNELIQTDVAQKDALPATEQALLIRDLRRELGAPQYDQLVSDARNALKAGEAWHKGIECSRAALQWLAVIGRANQAADREWQALSARRASSR